MNDLLKLLNNWMGLNFDYQDEDEDKLDLDEELGNINDELDAILNDEVNNIDLTNDKDYNDIVKKIKNLKSSTNGTFKLLSSLCGIDDKVYDNLLEILEKRRNELLEEKKDIQNTKEEVKTNDYPATKIVKDKSEEPKKEEIHRPSQDISVEAGLQIHKLVQEYIDTMVKPYNPKVGGLSTQQINDAYAGLYEFACWIFNK